MPKGLTFLSSLAILAVLALPAAAAPDADTVVARVNDREITLGHMIVARAILPQKYQQLPADVLFDAILDQLIQQSTLEQSRTGSVPKLIGLQLENERRSLLAADAMEQIMAGAAGEAEIKAAYDAKYASGFGGDEFHAAHILVETEEEAHAVIDELDSGTEFAEVAKAKSTGPSGPGGGDLGWLSLGATVPEFETAMVALKPGELSGAVQTQFGWHVIILNDKRKSAAPDLDEVRQELASQLQQDAVEAAIEDLTAKADIERPEIEGMSPELILDLNLIGN